MLPQTDEYGHISTMLTSSVLTLPHLCQKISSIVLPRLGAGPAFLSVTLVDVRDNCPPASGIGRHGGGLGVGDDGIFYFSAFA